jgi:hypothetical protein
MMATQPGDAGSPVTPDRPALGGSARARLASASSHDVGCVDWYLYPLSKAAPPGTPPRTPSPRDAGSARHRA